MQIFSKHILNYPLHKEARPNQLELVLAAWAESQIGALNKLRDFFLIYYIMPMGVWCM